MIKLSNISKKLSFDFAITDLNAIFPSGKTSTIIGPSGCGKTTILKLLSGILQADKGEIKFDEIRLNFKSSLDIRKQIGYVIQSGGLFPHLSAFQNIVITALAEKRLSNNVKTRVDELCEITHFPVHLLSSYPSQLSGGQAQRVGLMRALFGNPKFLLLDEPLGALDPLIRSGLQIELKEIFQSLKNTVVLVTHDLHEAAYFSDIVFLMRNGRIEQHGKIDELINSPKNEFVDEFISAQRAVI